MKPKFYYHDTKIRGHVEQIHYTAYNVKGEAVEKYANVYLPAAYDGEKRFNILYLMHGGGGSPDAWFDSCPLKNVFDYSIGEEGVSPCIVVTPTYYTAGNTPDDFAHEGEKTLLFQKELVRDLIPAVESKYHTYAKTTDAEGLKASRMHRAFGGFSMGSVTTWNALLENIDAFAYFLPLSGDSWIIEQLGGKEHGYETAKAIHDKVLASGYKPDEYFIYFMTGTKDIAYDQVKGQVNGMLQFPDTFIEATGFNKGNFLWHYEEGAVHSYEWVCNYVYQALPYLFK